MPFPVNELGATLRSWRDQLSPEEFGLPVAPHRRARGLRREELARLAAERLAAGGAAAGKPGSRLRRAVEPESLEPDVGRRARRSLDRPERERNMAWRHFTGLPMRIVRTAAQQREYEEAIVADLRSSSGRYPSDQALAQLIADLREASLRFRRLWETRHVGTYEQERKTITHPELGLLSVDCDVLTHRHDDLRVVIFTAAPGSPCAKALEELSTTLR